MRPSKSFQNLTEQAPSSSSQSQFVGILEERDAAGKVVNSRRIHTDQELIIGRDGNRCQYVLDDPVISNKHLRVYSVVYNGEKPNDVAPLVYAEDLSRNGTFWNGSLIGKGNGGFLLSDKDTLRVSARILFVYHTIVPREEDNLFDLTQEHEMKHFCKDYIITDRVLGAGACGRVHMAIEQFQRKQLACKIVDLRKLQPPNRVAFGRWEQPAAAENIDSGLQLAKAKSWGQKQKKDNRLEEKLKTCYREADILASLNHPNIIGLEKVYVTNHNIYIFQDLVTAGDLFSYIEHKNGTLIDVEAAVIVRQVLLALNFLHEKNIVHRDLKPENILMTALASGCRVVLTDFGCARRLDHQRTRMLTCMGTYEYTAPEVSHNKTSKVKETGYTKAVDLWSLGCVTVVLLTGGYAFFEAESGEYSERLAGGCNLDVLEKSQSWRDVGARPKAFVRGLLVLDERQRMTAKESLAHEWFTNDAHRTDFEELYRRATRHWRPRMPKEPVIELVEADNLESLPFSQGFRTESQKGLKRGPIPVDPPYKPFPRRLHSQAFFPRRKPSPFNKAMSDEVKAAIERNWTFDKSHSSEPSVVEEELPTLRSVGLERGGDDQSTNKLRDKRLVPITISKKPRFQPLHPNSSMTKSYGAGNQPESCSNKLKSRENVSSTVDSAEKDMIPVRKVYSHTAEKEAHALTSVPNSKVELALPTRPMTPRPPKTLSDSNVGLGPSPPTRYSTMTQHSGRYFAGHSSSPGARKPEERDVCVDQQSHSSDRHNFGQAIDSPSQRAKRRANHPLQSLSEATLNEGLLNSESEERVDSTRLFLNTPRSSSHDTNAYVRAARLEATPTELRLNLPTRAVGKTLGSQSFDAKKRRSNSIFDFEQDSAPRAPVKSKKARFDQEDVDQYSQQTSINATFALTKATFEDRGCTNTQVEKMLGETSIYRGSDLRKGICQLWPV